MRSVLWSQQEARQKPEYCVEIVIQDSGFALNITSFCEARKIMLRVIEERENNPREEKLLAWLVSPSPPFMQKTFTCIASDITVFV
jgi:hypothetical protein